MREDLADGGYEEDRLQACERAIDALIVKGQVEHHEAYDENAANDVHDRKRDGRGIRRSELVERNDKDFEEELEEVHSTVGDCQRIHLEIRSREMRHERRCGKND